jgi:predicted RNase H-like HicB family nuclease
MIVPISKVKVRRDEDGVFIAKCELLPGCHAHRRDRGEAILRFQQAAKCISKRSSKPAVRSRRPSPTNSSSPPEPWGKSYPAWNCRQLEKRLREIGCELVRTTGGHRH